jgi:hypothetical protein
MHHAPLGAARTQTARRGNQTTRHTPLEWRSEDTGPPNPARKTTPAPRGRRRNGVRGDRSGAHPRRGSSQRCESTSCTGGCGTRSTRTSGAHELERHRPLDQQTLNGETPRDTARTGQLLHHAGEKPTGVTGAIASAEGATDSPPEQHPEVAEAHPRNAAMRRGGGSEPTTRGEPSSVKPGAVQAARGVRQEAAGGEGNTSKGDSVSEGRKLSRGR